MEAAVLTKYGAIMTVPSPERYAVHKLIVSPRGMSPAKAP
ncbi:GSU2403 family nucleotidyltransferase fold protein [Hyphomonas neptunium]